MVFFLSWGKPIGSEFTKHFPVAVILGRDEGLDCLLFVGFLLWCEVHGM